jgi:hypothetical protein
VPETPLDHFMMNSSPNSTDLTIVINTCDAYQDVLEIFFHAFKAHWPDCPYPVVINTESNTHEYPAYVHNYFRYGGKDDWGDRLRCTLKSIDSEFVLMLYDDFILDSHVSNQRVQQALAKILSNSRAVVAYLINTDLPLESVVTDEMFVAIKDRVDFRLNSAPAIWRKETLILYTSPGDNPWAWEVFGTYKTWGDGNVYYALNPIFPAVYSYNNRKGGAVYRGKWVREVVEQVAQAYPLSIDWSYRGFSSDTTFEKRSIIWKLQFLYAGFRMVGWRVVFFITGYIGKKFNVR